MSWGRTNKAEIASEYLTNTQWEKPCLTSNVNQCLCKCDRKSFDNSCLMINFLFSLNTALFLFYWITNKSRTKIIQNVGLILLVVLCLLAFPLVFHHHCWFDHSTNRNILTINCVNRCYDASLINTTINWFMHPNIKMS